MGLPRSGKSTIVADLAVSLGAPIVRRDAIRLALTGQRFQILAEPMVKAVSAAMLRSLIISGHQTVIVDETNYSRAARDFLKDPMWDVVFYEIHTSPEVCCQRAVMTGQQDLMPVIRSMFSRYEPLGDDEVRYDPSQPPQTP